MCEGIFRDISSDSEETLCTCSFSVHDTFWNPLSTTKENVTKKIDYKEFIKVN
jgi:hypothetical protein